MTVTVNKFLTMKNNYHVNKFIDNLVLGRVSITQ